MNRVIGVLAVAVMLLVMIGLAVLIIWLAVERSRWAWYVLGGLMVVSGIGLSLVNRWTDEDLRRAYGEANASRMRRAARGGWSSIVLGAALVALMYFFG